MSPCQIHPRTPRRTLAHSGLAASVVPHGITHCGPLGIPTIIRSAMKTHFRNILRLSFSLAVVIIEASILQQAAAAGFHNTGPMITARSLHTATSLSNGKVLVTGGSATELYDPAIG